MPKENKSLFRKEALEDISSPERLNQALEISSPMGWVAITMLGIVLAVVIGWSIWGSIATEVSAQGMIINRQGILNIQAEGNGKVEHLAVSLGDTVSEDQVIATLQQPDLQQKLNNEQEMLSEIQQDHDLFVNNALEKLRFSRISADEQKKKLKENIETVNDRIAFLRKKLSGREILYRDSLIIEEKVFNVQQNLSEARVKKSELEHQLVSVEANYLEMKHSISLDTLKNHQKVIDQQRVVKNVQQTIERESKVRSNYRGRIVELLAYEGDLIPAQQAVARINPEGNNYQAVIFASPYHGKQITRGMEVHVSPSTVRREQYGSIVANVQSVSEVPASPEGIENLLHNQDLVQLVSQSGPPIQVIVELQHDEQGNFTWTSSEGPPHSITTGTLCTATVTVKEQAPISLVIPILKKTAGL